MHMFQATPVVPAVNMARALAFFSEVLGFEIKLQQGNAFAYLARDGAAIRIVGSQRAEADDTPLPPGAHTHIYVDVNDADRAYADLLPSLEGLPAGWVERPSDQLNGRREFVVTGPDGIDVTIGSGPLG